MCDFPDVVFPHLEVIGHDRETSRIDADQGIDRKQDPWSRLVLRTYAESPTRHRVLFAINALIGVYPGMFSIMPYYLKVREYNDLENRDIWEYELNLTPQRSTDC